MINVSMAKNKMENEEGMNHLLIKLSPKKPKERVKETKPVAFVLAVDVSGSMSGLAEEITTNLPISEHVGSKLDFVKNAAEKLVDMMKDGDAFGMVSFSDIAKTEYPLSLLTKEERFAIKGSIRALKTQGMTNVSEGLAYSFQQFTNEIKQTHQVKIILLSDGEANRGITEIDTLSTIVKGYQKEGVSVSSIGVGLDYNSYFMENIATSAGGMFYHLTEMKQLQTILETELENAHTLTTKQVNVVVEVPAGISLSENMNGYMETETGKIMIGDLYREQDIVVEFATKEPVKPGKITLTVRMEFINEDDQREMIEENVYLELVAEDELGDVLINHEVVEEVKKIMDAKTKKEAAKHYESGEFLKLQNVFNNGKTNYATFHATYNIEDEQMIDEIATLEHSMMERKLDKNSTKQLYANSFNTMRKK